jgi:hypothetical protein
VARSVAHGVRSAPHFLHDGHMALNGGRSEKELSAAIRAKTNIAL